MRTSVARPVMTIASMSDVTRARAASTNDRWAATALIELSKTCSPLCCPLSADVSVPDASDASRIAAVTSKTNQSRR